jgi:polygalacturonase
MKRTPCLHTMPPNGRSLVVLPALLLILALIAAPSARAAETVGWELAAQILKRIQPPIFPERDFDVTTFGAVADDKTTCTEAFRKAVEACHAAGGGRVVVPAGRFLTGPIHLKSNVNLHLADEATLLFSTDPKDYLPPVFSRFEGVECMNYSPLIYAFEQENVAVTGKGKLDGQADNKHWWPWKGRKEFGYLGGQPNQNAARVRLFEMAARGVPVAQRVMGEGSQLRPSFIEFYRCKNVLIEGVTIERSPMWEIHPLLCENVTVRGVAVNSHGPNNDGCDPESCKDVLIEKCTFDTGDDCIALKSGRNEDGRRLNVPIENVIVRDCTMRDGHGGVVIGSEISGGARNVFAEDCAMDSPNLDRVLRIKTNSVRGGTIENVFLRNIKVGQVTDAILLVDLYYEEGDSGPYAPTIRNIHIAGIASKKSKYALFARGYERAPIHDVYLENCAFDNVEKGNDLEHIDGLHATNVTINGQPFEPDKPRARNAQAATTQTADLAPTAGPPTFSTDFEHNSAAGWTPSIGQWEVVDDEGNKVYAAISGEESRAHAGDAAWTDYRVQARVKVVEFGGENRAYVCGRYKDGNNYYAASLYNRDEGGMLELRKKLDKKTRNVTTKPLELSEGKWYQIALEMQGNTIRVYVDGELQLTATDDSLKQGGIGLIAYNAKVEYDDVKVMQIAAQ